MDFCVAAAGILRPPRDCLEYPAQEYREVSGCRRVGCHGQFFEINPRSLMSTPMASSSLRRLLVDRCRASDAVAVSFLSHQCQAVSLTKCASLKNCCGHVLHTDPV
jgi:hypothetical protein